MNYQHQSLADGRWREFSFFEQMANIGSEVQRAIKWKNKDNVDYRNQALERALELIDLTVADRRNHSRLKELLRLREALVDYLAFDNNYHSSDNAWQNYFYAFTYAARANR